MNGATWLLAWAVAVGGMAWVLSKVPVEPGAFAQPAQAPSASIQSSSAPRLPVFEDRTIALGLVGAHLQGGEKLTGLDETLGAGACVLDYDNDGWMDLYQIAGSGQTRFYGRREWWQRARGNRLFRNVRGTHFEDVTQSAMPGVPNDTGASAAWGMGCAAADLDADGDTDLVLTNLRSNQLLRNNGDGTFADVTERAGFSGEYWSTKAAIGDYDGDGLLDIYIANFIQFERGARTYESLAQFKESIASTFVVERYDSAPNVLYRNLGDLRFEDVTRATGVSDSRGRSLDAHWADLDGDNAAELVVSNATGSPDRVFKRQRNGRYEDVADVLKFSSPGRSAGLAIADFDGDARVEAVVGMPSGKPLRLHTAAGSQQYRDISRDVGVGSETDAAMSQWGVAIADLNNDGRLDIFAATGLAVPDPDALKVPQGQPNQLWLGDPASSGIFLKRAAHGTDTDVYSGRGALRFDYDNDGDIDLFVTANNGIGQLLHNPSRESMVSSTWVGLSLQGRGHNRDAIGAQVHFHTQRTVQVRRASGGSTFLGSDDPRVHAAFAPADPLQFIEVHWPDGTRQRVDAPPLNQYLTLHQGDAVRTTPMRPAGTPRQAADALAAIEVPAHRVALLGWLGQREPDARAWRLLEAGLRDRHTSVRMQAVTVLAEMEGARSLDLLIRALGDVVPDVRAHAMAALRPLESEVSIRWMLRGLSDPSSQVRCAAADAFAHFFREEEAVVVQKYLALSPLIRMLDSDAGEARVCAARALGDAERYRAIVPLIGRLSDSVVEVRREAVRALGLVRIADAAPSLLERLDDADETAGVRAQAIIALRRLNYASNEVLLARLARTGPSSQLSVLQALLSNDKDNVVIARRSVVGALESALRKNQQVTAVPNEESLVLALRALASTKARSVLPTVRMMFTHQRPRVRAAAMTTAIAVDHRGAANHVMAALADPDLDVTRDVLEAAVRERVRVDAADIAPWLEHPQLREVLTRLLANLASSGNQQVLLSHGLDTARTVETRVVAIDALRIKRPDAMIKLLESSHASVRLAAARWWHRTHPKSVPRKQVPESFMRIFDAKSFTAGTAAVELLAARREPWAQEILLQWVSRRDARLDVRHTALTAMGRLPVGSGRRTILRIARSRHDPLSSAALALLNPANDEEAARYLWRILETAREPEAIRFVAASTLVEQSPARVISTLLPGTAGD